MTRSNRGTALDSKQALPRAMHAQPRGLPRGPRGDEPVNCLAGRWRCQEWGLQVGEYADAAEEWLDK
jgi:hypothetical protein